VRVFQIDLDAADADWQLHAIKIWPDDFEARDNFIVKAAALSKVTVEVRTPQLAARELERHLQTVLPMLPDEVRLPYAEALAEKVARQVNEIRAGIITEIDRDYFRPHGGLGREVYAPGLDAIRHEAEATAGGKYGRACGEILGYIVMMRWHHHPELRPSVRLATHIMVERAKFEGRSIPDDHDRKKLWRKGGWGGVAPLWAARTLAAPTPGIHRVPVKLIIQYAHWLADFAVKFRPCNSALSWRLLDEASIVRVNPELPPLEPPIPPLPDQLLGWARSYEE
jgi:hypothetical protein